MKHQPTRMRMISFFIPASDANNLKAIAAKNGIGYSQILRELVKTEIAKTA